MTWSVSAFFFRVLPRAEASTPRPSSARRPPGNQRRPARPGRGVARHRPHVQRRDAQVILPQAMRASVPPLTSVQIALLKNTSVAAVFGIVEATAQMRSSATATPTNGC